MPKTPDDVDRSGRSREFRDENGLTLPQRIRHRRRARSVLSKDLAEALRVSPSYVTMIERGKKVPSEDVAVAIARFLGDDPELYRAWVHSTRFTDPTSTLRGLQRLYYRGPQNRPAPSASLQSASQRARRRQVDRFSAKDEGLSHLADTDDLKFCMPEGLAGRRIEGRLRSPTVATPLIALGRIEGNRVAFWRLPWALLDNDSRPLRFVVCGTPDPDTLLVATPEQFVDIVMKDSGTDLMDSEDWRGWDGEPLSDGSGGVHAQSFDAHGKFGRLLCDKKRFLDGLGDEVDVIVLEGTGVSIRRLTLAELEARLTRPV